MVFLSTHTFAVVLMAREKAAVARCMVDLEGAALGSGWGRGEMGRWGEGVGVGRGG